MFIKKYRSPLVETHGRASNVQKNHVQDMRLSPLLDLRSQNKIKNQA